MNCIVWADALVKEVYPKCFAKIQRRGALGMAPAYCTVSELAVKRIAGIIPVAFLAKEREAIFKRKEEKSKVVAAVKNANVP